MSTSAITRVATAFPIDTEDSCKIVVFYENAEARTGALSVCERVVDQFAEDLDFEFKWWKFKRLADPAFARHALDAAMSADIVMFCPHSFELNSGAAEWLENWAESGFKSGAAIALVIPGRPDLTGAAKKLIDTFKWAAQRLGMDFLHVTVPTASTPNQSDKSQVVVPLPAAERPHAYHWGLNE